LDGVPLEANEAEAVAVFRDLASGTIGEDVLSLWFERNVSQV